MSTAAIFEHHDFSGEEPGIAEAKHDSKYDLKQESHYEPKYESSQADLNENYESGEYAIEEQKPEQPSLWRSILQLRVLLPYLGKILPMLEGNMTNITTALTPAPKQDMMEVNRSFSEVNKGFLDLQTGHREIRTQVQEQTVQLKRIDDQLLRLRESTERNTMEHQELVEDLRSASTLVRTLSTVMIVLMVGVAAMVIFMLAHWHH